MHPGEVDDGQPQEYDHGEGRRPGGGVLPRGQRQPDGRRQDKQHRQPTLQGRSPRSALLPYRTIGIFTH